MFVYNDARHDARVWREAGTLTDAGYEVAVIALQPGGLPDRERRPQGLLLRVGADGGVAPGDPSPYRDGGGIAARVAWLRGYRQRLLDWRAAAALTGVEIAKAAPVRWHGHDLTGLMAATRARSLRSGALVYDSHELFVEAGSASRLPKPAKALLARYEDRLARRADAVLTVNESIRAELRARFGQDPTVVMNCPPLGPEPIDRMASVMRIELGLGTRPVVLHHGGIAAGRGIRDTVAALDHLPSDVALVILGDGELVPALNELSRSDLYRGRLYTRAAVSMDALPRWIAGADVGVIAFEPVDRNNVLGTPNKLFEYMAAGVPSVVSDFPEMRRIVVETSAGVTCHPGDPTSIARSISMLLAESSRARSERRRTCRRAAAERYNWANEGAKLLHVYDSLG